MENIDGKSPQENKLKMKIQRLALRAGIDTRREEPQEIAGELRTVLTLAEAVARVQQDALPAGHEWLKRLLAGESPSDIARSEKVTSQKVSAGVESYARALGKSGIAESLPGQNREVPVDTEFYPEQAESLAWQMRRENDIIVGLEPSDDRSKDIQEQINQLVHDQRVSARLAVGLIVLMRAAPIREGANEAKIESLVRETRRDISLKIFNKTRYSQSEKLVFLLAGYDVEQGSRLEAPLTHEQLLKWQMKRVSDDRSVEEIYDSLLNQLTQGITELYS